jgi:hypothetical protein
MEGQRQTSKKSYPVKIERRVQQKEEFESLKSQLYELVCKVEGSDDLIKIKQDMIDKYACISNGITCCQQHSCHAYMIIL